MSQTDGRNPTEWPNCRSIMVEVFTKETVLSVNALAFKLDRAASYHKLQGITASQLGTDRRVALANLAGDQVVFVNPTITNTQGNVVGFERCICFSRERYLVSRPEKITVEYFTDKLKRVRKTFGGNEAKLICHLIDHMDLVTLEELEAQLPQGKSRPKIDQNWIAPYVA